MKSKKKQVKKQLEKKPSKTPTYTQTSSRKMLEDKILKMIPFAVFIIGISLVLYNFQPQAWVPIVFTPIVGFGGIMVILIIFRKIYDIQNG